MATFSLDVDTGNYANARRFLSQGLLPPPGVVRVEEIVNYLPSGWDIKGKQSIPASKPIPLAMRYELAPAPWNGQRALLEVGIPTEDRRSEELPASNLVLLIDASGSMASDECLPLIQSPSKLLAKELREQDSVTVAAHADDPCIMLPSISGGHKAKINTTTGSLDAEDSTNDGVGLETAYQQVVKGFIKGGINHILLTTDGDFDVGIDDPKSIESMVKEQCELGVTLSTLGAGDSNYGEAITVRITDVGNSNYSYIDTLSKAQKVLNSEIRQTLIITAKDAKARIGFNPTRVTEYRQIDYEERQLRVEDFNNDDVSAGDIDANKHATFLFESVLKGQKTSIDKLRYVPDNRPVKLNKTKELA